MLRPNLLFLTFNPFWPLMLRTAVCLPRAGVGRVDQQALLAAVHVEDELLHRHVRHSVEHRLQPAVLGADHAAQLHVDLAVQVGEQVRQVVVGGDEVDVALELFVEQRRDRFRLTVDRCRRAGLRGQLRPGADGADVALIEEQRVRHRQRGAGDVGVALMGFQDRPQLRVLVALGAALEPDEQLRLELQAVAAVGRVGSAERVGAERGRIGRVGAATAERADRRLRGTVGRIEHEFVAIDVEVDRANVELDPAEHVGDRIRHGVDLGRFRIDVERDPDDHGADVIRPGHPGGDRDHRERRPLVRTGEERPAGDLDRAAAAAGGGRRGADLAGGRTAVVGRLRRAAAGRGGRDGRLGAVGDAGELAGQALRQGDVDGFQLLFAVPASDPHPERAVGAGLGVVRARRVGGREGPLGQRLRATAPGRVGRQREAAGRGGVSLARTRGSAASWSCWDHRPAARSGFLSAHRRGGA